MALHFDADFADLFEVRARTANAAARALSIMRWAITWCCATWGDRVERRTIIRWDREPDRGESGVVVFSVTLQPQQATELEIAVTCEVGEASLDDVRYADIVDKAERSALNEVCECRVVSSNEASQSLDQDPPRICGMMLTETA